MLRRPRTLAIALILLSSSVAAACTDSGEPPPSTTAASTPRSSPTAPAAPHQTATTLDGATGDEPQIVFFEAPTEVPCAGPEASVSTTYETVNATAIGFAVDGVSADGSGPPLSGSYQLRVPCDGNAHTLLLVAVGVADQAVSTQAVRTAPSG
jgi:hypothetical protein